MSWKFTCKQHARVSSGATETPAAGPAGTPADVVIGPCPHKSPRLPRRRHRSGCQARIARRSLRHRHASKESGCVHMVAQTSALLGASVVHSLLQAGMQSTFGSSAASSSLAEASPASPAAAVKKADASSARRGRPGRVALHDAEELCREAGAIGALLNAEAPAMRERMRRERVIAFCCRWPPMSASWGEGRPSRESFGTFFRFSLTARLATASGLCLAELARTRLRG